MGNESKLSTQRCNVPIKIQEHRDYINFHKKIDLEKYKHDELMEMSYRLFSEDVDLEKKREVLFRLAHSGAVDSYRILEKYFKNAHKKLKSWVVLCMEECRMFLESDLLESEREMIFGGVGGGDGRMRYYFAVPFGDCDFIKRDRSHIDATFRAVAEKFGGLMEKIQFSKNYVLVTALISFEVAVEDVVMRSICSINKEKKLLRGRYFCTNVSRPTKNEIEKYLEEI